MSAETLILGIESSCDDTAAALVRGVPGRPIGEVLGSHVFSQNDLHAAFGGVVPEIAARAHAERLDICVANALNGAGVGLESVDGIAVTAGPGLIGGVLSGVMFAKGLAASTGKPIIGVSHLSGHALTPRLISGASFPYLMLLVSGGHCQFILVEGADRYRRLGGTIDDAPGEAFDKVARLLDLGYPGGPEVEQQALKGNSQRFRLPRPLLDRPGCDMSFSGLKTATRRQRDLLIAEQGGLYRQDLSDLCAGFQAAVADVLAEKTRRACHEFEQLTDSETKMIAVAGGVAANKAIRSSLEQVCQETGFEFVAPPLWLCTDNAAMIAWAGIERLALGDFDDMSLSARPRWPLDTSAEPLLGAGKKGAKA